MCPEVTGHVSVHVTETVEGSQGEVEDEASQDGENSSIGSVPDPLAHPSNHPDAWRCKFFGFQNIVFNYPSETCST